MEAIPYSDAGGAIAALLLCAAALWKIYLRIRKDTREDHAERTQGDNYAAIIEQLRMEVSRLARAVNELGSELETERRKRHAAEARVSRLESELATLKNGGGAHA